MSGVLYHRHAVKYLSRMPEDRKHQIKSVLSEVARLEDPLTHHHVKVMAGEWAGCFRLRIGNYRAIFRLVERDEGKFLEILQVGPRGDIYG